MSLAVRGLQIVLVSLAIVVGVYGTLTSKPAPTNLSLTASDGTPVDLSAMRGKVVLLDFWATSCGPCREEVPNVVATYHRYHDQGCEVIGVSLHQDLGDMTRFTRENGMVWPQYFDGRGWDNEVARRFYIHSIPTIWLFDSRDGWSPATRGTTWLAREPTCSGLPETRPAQRKMSKNFSKMFRPGAPGSFSPWAVCSAVR